MYHVWWLHYIFQLNIETVCIYC